MGGARLEALWAAVVFPLELVLGLLLFEQNSWLFGCGCVDLENVGCCLCCGVGGGDISGSGSWSGGGNGNTFLISGRAGTWFVKESVVREIMGVTGW